MPQMRRGGASILVGWTLRMGRALPAMPFLIERALDPLQFLNEGCALRAKRLGMTAPLSALPHFSWFFHRTAPLPPFMPHVARPPH